MDVEPRPQENIRALADHFLAEQVPQSFHGLHIPGAGQGCAAGQQGRIVAHPDAGGAVGGGEGGHALVPEGLGGAPKHPGVALGAQGAVHRALPLAQGVQLLRS